jgi:hypothetical protein
VLPDVVVSGRGRTLIVDPSRPYAALFPADVRAWGPHGVGVERGHAVRVNRQEDLAAAAQADAERVTRVREEMRSGKRKRLDLPELDQGL